MNRYHSTEINARREFWLSEHKCYQNYKMESKKQYFINVILSIQKFVFLAQ